MSILSTLPTYMAEAKILFKTYILMHYEKLAHGIFLDCRSSLLWDYELLYQDINHMLWNELLIRYQNKNGLKNLES
jgi:hypothetical protein